MPNSQIHYPRHFGIGTPRDLQQSPKYGRHKFSHNIQRLNPKQKLQKKGSSELWAIMFNKIHHR